MSKFDDLERDKLIAIAEASDVEIPRLRAEVARLGEALMFYADPGTYFAWAFASDPPCGDWGTDFSETDELGYKPGKRAREALALEGGTIA